MVRVTLSVDEGRRGPEDARIRKPLAPATGPARASGSTYDHGETHTAAADGSSPPSSPPLEAVRVIAPLQYRDRDRYEVLGEHGRGGIGRVQRAYDKELDRSVAIKELLKRGDMGEVRFVREAMITARLEHPGIVPIHEAGRWSDGTPFYAMKLVAGRSLKELIEERASIEQRLELLHHVIAVTDAVAYAHERGIIHRDLKPGNVIAGDFGETIVIDWGLAKEVHSRHEHEVNDGSHEITADRELTVDGSVLGTPLYMSPEQARGERVDQRTDVFAIGAMLWQLCSLASVPPQNLRQRERMLRKSHIDQDLVAIITKALQPVPADRYGDAGELAADLKAFKSGSRIAAREYSLVAMFARWVRRNRVVALTVAIATALVLAGSALYLRNTARERDRADVAASRAEEQRRIAAEQRDHARLAEAAALLEKDPTRAQWVLDKLPSRTPQHAMLRSRATVGAATRVLEVAWGVWRLSRHPVTSELAVVTNIGELALVDAEAGTLTVIAGDLQDFAPAGNGWIYARKSFRDKDSVIETAPGGHRVNVGSLLLREESTLLVVTGRTYALDGDELYAVDETGPVLMRRDVRAIAGSDRVLMICSRTGVLEVLRDGVLERRTRCASEPTLTAMAAVGTDYAALLDRETLLLVRRGTAVHIRTRVVGEYVLSLATSGLLGTADLEGRPAFVRSDGNNLELGPPHPARVLGVAADGNIVAWGFADGTVVAQDTQTGQTWKFIGHAAGVYRLVVDARHARVLSGVAEQLRIWSLRSSAIDVDEPLPCLAFNSALAADGMRVVLDCNDGAVREWSLRTDELRVLHRHATIAHGVAWLHDAACSAGWDGRVICTGAGGTREVRAAGARVQRLAANPAGDDVAFATSDGAIATATRGELYHHTTSYPYSLEFSADGSRIATGAYDGSVIVYDMITRRIMSAMTPHRGLVFSIQWRGGELWTAGMDGTIRRWREQAGTFVEIETLREAGAVRRLRVFPDGWSATIGGNTLVVKRGSRELRLDLGRRIERGDVSADFRYVAAGTGSEVVVLDLERAGVAVLPIASRFGHVGLARPGFVTVSDGVRLLALRLTSLPYSTWQWSSDE
jgi:eukaryotic-like serine/threonine-protein kinase